MRKQDSYAALFMALEIEINKNKFIKYGSPLFLSLLLVTGPINRELQKRLLKKFRKIQKSGIFIMKFINLLNRSRKLSS